MIGAPFAPWTLRGETVVGFARRHPAIASPEGLRRLPGPTMITASCFDDSPVGPFRQLSVAVPARVGARLGWCCVLSVVDVQDARVGHRLNWGFPVELSRLRWRVDDDRRELAWDERGVVVVGRARGPRLPMAVPHRHLQHRGDGPVLVPDRLVGLFRPAVVRFQAYPGDVLARLSGAHVGTLVHGANRVMREARTPVGLVAPLRVAAPAAEPLLADTPRAS